MVDKQQAYTSGGQAASPHLASMLAIAQGEAAALALAQETAPASHSAPTPAILPSERLRLLAPKRVLRHMLNPLNASKH